MFAACQFPNLPISQPNIRSSSFFRCTRQTSNCHPAPKKREYQYLHEFQHIVAQGGIRASELQASVAHSRSSSNGSKRQFYVYPLCSVVSSPQATISSNLQSSTRNRKSGVVPHCFSREQGGKKPLFAPHIWHKHPVVKASLPYMAN